MSEIITNLAGWIPAIVLPTATMSQLVKIAREQFSRGSQSDSMATFWDCKRRSLRIYREIFRPTSTHWTSRYSYYGFCYCYYDCYCRKK